MTGRPSPIILGLLCPASSSGPPSTAGGRRRLATTPSCANQLLCDGALAWTELPSRHAPAERASEPVSQRQMLDRLLDDDGASKSAPRCPARNTLIPLFPISLGVHS